MTEPPIPGLMLAALMEAGATAILCWWFVWRYSRVNWKRTAEGRHVMRLTVALGLMFTLTVAFNVAPVPLIWRAIASVVLFGFCGAEMYTRVNLLHEAQRDND